MLFKEIYGHSEIKDRLIRTMVDKRVSHAIMLYGPEGSGKFALALAYAQLLQCSGEKNGDSCGECASCQQAAKLIHPDIHFVFPVVKGKVSNTEQNDNKRANSDGKKGNTDPVSDNFIASWRSFISESPYPGLQSWLQYLDVENKQGGIFKMEAEALIKKLSLKAFESEFKVVIFWLPEKMNPTTANKLLKIIEEPPEKTVFIFVAEQIDTILPTILSRTQLIRVPKLNDSELLESLKQAFPESSDKIADIVPLADGNFIKAQQLLHTDEQMRFFQEQFIRWLRLAFRFKVNDILDWIPGIVNLGRERQKAFLQYGLHIIRENFLLNQQMEEHVRLSASEREFSSRFNSYIHTGNIEALTNVFSMAIQHITINANPRILFLDMSAQLYTCLKMKPQ